MGKLDGKIGLITGGSDGIGFATAQHFLNEGAAHVFIIGRRQDALNEAIKKLGNKKVTAIQSDTSNLNDLDKLFDTIKNKQGHLDPNHSVYAATKAALRSFARTWTVDLKERKIRVNTLSPGPIDTPGLRKATNNEEQRKQMYASLASGTVMGHVGTADEIAKAAVFLPMSKITATGSRRKEAGKPPDPAGKQRK